MLALFEGYLDRKGVADEGQYDLIRQGGIVCLGTLARHLHSDVDKVCFLSLVHTKYQLQTRGSMILFAGEASCAWALWLAICTATSTRCACPVSYVCVRTESTSCR